jgi:hypothetical protein
MGCTKALDFAAGLPVPNNYWPLTSIVGGNAPDTIGANPLVLGKVSLTTFVFSIGGSQSVVVGGGLITNAMSFPSTSFPSFLDVAKSTNPLNLSSASSFTFRIWVKEPSGGVTSNAEMRFVLDPGDLNTHSGGAHVAISGDGFYMHRPAPYDEQELDFSADDPGVVAWHRIIILFDATTSTMMAKFDNKTTRTFINPVGSSVNILDLLTLFIDGTTTLLCECGLWENLVLTEPQMLVDWNGGAGVTFP